MNKFGIATIFENSAVGYEFTANNIPLHLTHVDSFEVALSLSELEIKLKNILAQQKSFKVMALKDTYYGPDKNILVTEVELNPDLVNLHKLIMGLLTGEGATLKNPHFHKDGYSPHVSVYGARRINVGDLMVINQISVASKTSADENAATKILATLNFES